MNWEDLRYILAVSREGSLVGAAKALKVSPTTMTRRLKSLEEDQGTKLFEKLKHGALLSQAGERTVAVAEAVERLTNELNAEIHGLDTKLQGTVRVTSTELLSKHFLPDIAAFSRQYDDIQVELTSSTSIANMTQREADVAIRLGPKAPDHLVGSRYATMWYAVYGQRELVDRIGCDAPYNAFPWVGWDLSVNRLTDEWLNKEAPGAKVVLRLSSMAVKARSAATGIGLAVLPCVVGDTDPALIRVGGYLEGSSIHLWLLTHPRLRGAARIAAFMASMRQAIARDTDLIEGRRPRVP